MNKAIMDILASGNVLLAEKLRNDDPEQFYTLVKMHLSFVLDLNMDESDANPEKKIRSLKWNLPFTKKKLCTKSCIEGTQLTCEFIEQIRQLIHFLSVEENISQEGIFRRSGKVTRQQELKSLINQGIAINLNDGQYSVHDCATVLKNILAELPESVLTDAHYPAYCQIADLCTVRSVNSEEKLLTSLQLLILLLPSENRTFFQDIIALLHLAASHEKKNRMSADNLATLFTPHLICPRKLTPEALHVNSQLMSCVVAFMIQKGAQLFEIPLTLATDVQAYWNKKERRKISPLKQMNESVCDGTAANTVFTFVDRVRTAQENGANPTETALAQLYAYIQSLPESSKKRKLIKQFNKENGHGTPLRATVGKKRTRSRSLGDSIKKHLPAFTKNAKRTMQPLNFEEDEYKSPALRDNTSQKKISTCEFHEKHKENMPVLKGNLLVSKSVTVNSSKVVSQDIVDDKLCKSEEVTPMRSSSHRYLIHDSLISTESSEKDPATSNSKSDRDTSEEAFIQSQRNSTPPPEDLSLGKLPCNDKNEAEIGSIRITNEGIRRQWPVSNQMDEEGTQKICDANQNNSQLKPLPFVNSSNLANNMVEKPLLNACYKTPCKTTSLRHLDSQGFIGPGIWDDHTKTPSHKFSSNGNFPRFTNSDFHVSPNTTNHISKRNCSKSHLLMTSTPAPGNGCIITPIVDRNNSMSPITRSTQRMPKAMQETMMTPRSRKPVISLSGTDLCNLANVSSLSGNFSLNEMPGGKSRETSDFGKNLILEDTNEGNGSNSLSSTFRDYLFSRSVLTSPMDLSFSSRADDFLSLSENNTSAENEDFKSLAESILNDEALSESLLYCLDGNEPPNDSSDMVDKEVKISDNGSLCSTYLEGADEVNHIYETAL